VIRSDFGRGMLCSGRRDARGLQRPPRHDQGRRRAVDDGGARHRALGDVGRARHVQGLAALGQPRLLQQNVSTLLSLFGCSFYSSYFSRRDVKCPFSHASAQRMQVGFLIISTCRMCATDTGKRHSGSSPGTRRSRARTSRARRRTA
jgi:hypothetical protein